MQLLKDYCAFHSAFGGAMPLDETHVVDAAYGPGGMVQSGQAFEERDVPGLRKSYEKLEHALTMLKQEDFRAWMSLVTPYLGDPGDPSVVAEHRRKAEEGLFSARLFADRHDRAIRLLAWFLEKERLHVVFPKRMTSREETRVLPPGGGAIFSLPLERILQDAREVGCKLLVGAHEQVHSEIVARLGEDQEQQGEQQGQVS